MSSSQGMSEFRKKFKAFISSSDESVSFEAEITGNPEPYEEFLKGIKIKKSGGPSLLKITEDKWLELLGDTGTLNELAKRLKVTNDGDHSHFYSSPVSLIIEVDETWSG